MSGTTGPEFDQAWVDAVRERAREWLARTGKTQTALAKALNGSGAAVSQWLNGVYKGDVKLLTERIESFLALEVERSAAPVTPKFADTAVARSVLTVCSFAHTHRVIGMAVGAAGMGKTAGLKEYVRRNPKRAVYLTCNPACTSPQAVLSLILDHFNWRPEPGSGLHAQIRNAVMLLKETDYLVIFDEAQHCSYRSLETIRTVFDMAEVGMVWAGNEGLLGLIQKQGTTSYAQIYSRIAMVRVVLLGASDDDVRALVGDVSRECVKYLRERTFEGGGLRRMLKVHHLAQGLAQVEGTALDMGHMERAADMLVAV